MTYRTIGKQIQKIDSKVKDFDDRNVDLILKHSAEEGVYPVEKFGISREKLRYIQI